MKNKIIALIAVAALGLCGCKVQEKKESVGVIDAGGVSLGSSEGVISYGSSTSYSVNSSAVINRNNACIAAFKAYKP